jgi:hypothetical protein
MIVLRPNVPFQGTICTLTMTIVVAYCRNVPPDPTEYAPTYPRTAVKIRLYCTPTQDFSFLFFSLVHLAFAAFLASSLLSSGLRAAMRAFTPFPLAALPPFLPISRITLETRSRLMALFYDG